MKGLQCRLYFLQQFKKILFKLCVLYSILEYGSPPFHHPQTICLTEDLERLLKCALHIIYPELSFAEALNFKMSCLSTLSDRREANAAKLFDETCTNQFHSLHSLLPSKCELKLSLKKLALAK